MRSWISTIAAAAALTACASKQQVENVQLSPTVQLEVTNNFSPPDQVTVFVVTQSGGRQLLGSVGPGQRGRFTYRPTSASDKFMLRAQWTSGRTMTSQPFTLVNATSVAWGLQQNTIQIYE